jgi:hypothetical protein
LYLEDYSPTLRHKAGKKNVIADCLSRLPREEPRKLEGKNVVAPVAAYVDGMLDMFSAVSLMSRNYWILIWHCLSFHLTTGAHWILNGCNNSNNKTMSFNSS